MRATLRAVFAARRIPRSDACDPVIVFFLCFASTSSGTGFWALARPPRDSGRVRCMHRTPVHGSTGWAAARHDAGALRSGSRALLAVPGEHMEV
jgi:hypothetical protein